MSFGRRLFFFLLVISPFIASNQGAASNAMQLDSSTGGNTDCLSPTRIEYEEWHEHLIGPPPELRVESDDNIARINLVQIPIQVNVDCNGNVTHADFMAFDRNVTDKIPADIQQRLIQRANELHFRPFKRNGHSVMAQIPVFIPMLPVERLPSHHLPFPELKDPNTLIMSLERGNCFPACPIYRVRVHGDGLVEYDGTSTVSITGHHTVRISQSDVDQLLTLYRQADFFSLDDRYYGEWVEQNEDSISIDIDGESKKVQDIAGHFGGMPDSVTHIEEAIESVSGVERWTKGNSETIPALRQEGFDFDSNASILLIHRLAAYGDTVSVHAALEAGAPAIGRIEQRCYPTDLALLNEPQPLISAARRGQDEMLRDLLSHGAARNQYALGPALLEAAENGSLENVHLLQAAMAPEAIKSIRNDLLLSASASGNPELVSEVLKLHPVINTQNSPGVGPLYMALLRGFDRRSDAEVKEVVKLLLTAGTDPNLEICNGNTALFLTDFHPAIARILIAAGADIEKARGPFMSRPLADMRDVETTRVLLEAGADRNATDAKGQTALQIAIKRKQTDKADLLRNWKPETKRVGKPETAPLAPDIRVTSP